MERQPLYNIRIPRLDEEVEFEDVMKINSPTLGFCKCMLEQLMRSAGV